MRVTTEIDAMNVIHTQNCQITTISCLEIQTVIAWTSIHVNTKIPQDWSQRNTSIKQAHLLHPSENLNSCLKTFYGFILNDINTNLHLYNIQSVSGWQGEPIDWAQNSVDWKDSPLVHVFISNIKQIYKAYRNVSEHHKLFIKPG